MKEGKSAWNWSVSWCYLKLGAISVMLDKHEVAVELFQKVTEQPNTDKWCATMNKYAGKCLRNGGWYSMFELMMITGLMIKLLKNAGQHKAKVLIQSLEQLALKAEGSLDTTIRENLETNGPPKKGGVLGVLSFGFFGSTGETDTKVENRVLYLLLKGTFLQALQKTADSKKCLEEALYLKPLFNDTLTHLLILMELGKLHMQDDMDKASKYFSEAIRLSGYSWEDTIKVRLRGYMNQMGMSHTEYEQANDEDQQDIKDLEQAEGETRATNNSQEVENEPQHKQSKKTKKKKKKKHQNTN